MARRAYDEGDLNVLIDHSNVTEDQYTDGLIKYKNSQTLEELIEYGIRYIEENDQIRAIINLTLALCKIKNKDPIALFEYKRDKDGREGVDISVAIPND